LEVSVAVFQIIMPRKSMRESSTSLHMWQQDLRVAALASVIALALATEAPPAVAQSRVEQLPVANQPGAVVTPFGGGFGVLGVLGVNPFGGFSPFPFGGLGAGFSVLKIRQAKAMLCGSIFAPLSDFQRI
jgi:hypothetical protein